MASDGETTNFDCARWPSLTVERVTAGALWYSKAPSSIVRHSAIKSCSEANIRPSERNIQSRAMRPETYSRCAMLVAASKEASALFQCFLKHFFSFILSLFLAHREAILLMDCALRSVNQQYCFIGTSADTTVAFWKMFEPACIFAILMASPTLESLLVIAAAALVIYLVNLLWGRRNLPPGPWGWPVIGSMHLLGPRPHQTLQKMAERYGPLMSLRIGQKLFIVASSAEAAREFFKFQDANFSSRPFKRAFQVLMPNDIAFVEGNTPLRRHLRKIFQLELTSARRIQETEHVRTGEISKMLEALPEDCVITIRLYIEVMVTNVLSLMVFKKRYLAVAGKDANSTTEEIKEIEAFKRVLSDIAVNISQNNIGDVVPALRWLDPQGLESQYMQAKARMDSFSSKIIAEHLERRRDGARQSREHEKDLIDIFLDQVEEQKKHEVTLENVQSILWNAIAAGLAPIVAASEWALTESLRNPHILEKAQAELDDVLGKSRRLRESDIPKLKYIQAMVKEAFRLHPAPMPPPHESMEPCKAFGYDIPAKTGLLCNFYAIQRDAAVWHKPLEFDPSRFLEGSPTASISMNGLRSFDLIPFGSGRRSCPAIEMGTILVTLITANLLYAFEWSVPDRRELEDDTEDVDHTASRAVALTAIVKRRLPSELYT